MLICLIAFKDGNTQISVASHSQLSWDNEDVFHEALIDVHRVSLRDGFSIFFQADAVAVENIK